MSASAVSRSRLRYSIEPDSSRELPKTPFSNAMMFSSAPPAFRPTAPTSAATSSIPKIRGLSRVTASSAMPKMIAPNQGPRDHVRNIATASIKATRRLTLLRQSTAATPAHSPIVRRICNAKMIGSGVIAWTRFMPARIRVCVRLQRIP